VSRPPTQSWDPRRYAHNARFVSELGAPVVELLAPRPGERILDVGCGDGALTAKLVAAGCNVVGIDSSLEQIAAAQAAGLDAREADACDLSFDAEFDAVFSNAALHWVKRPEAPIDGAWRALRAGGRFVGELGGHGCVRTIERALVEQLQRRGIDAAAVSPWYFPTEVEYSCLLQARGFVVDSAALIPRPTPLPGDISGWLETFAQSFTSALPAADVDGFITDVREALRPHLCDPEGNWSADYVRLRFAARKPA
jgi:SAM-dependent methyltransferase